MSYGTISGKWMRSGNALALALLASLACGGNNAGEENSASPEDSTLVLGKDDVVTVRTREVIGGIPITGSLDPAEKVVLRGEIAGKLSSITVDRGDRVRQGQILARLDSRTFSSRVSASMASLAAAERDLTAADTLFKAGAVSRQSYTSAQASRDAAAAQLTKDQEDLDAARIVTPISGTVSSRDIDPGEVVKIGDPLLTIVNTTELEMETKVAPNYIGNVKLGQPVTLRLDAYPDKEITGRVSRIESVADAQTRQVSVFVRLDNRQLDLVGGLFATGTIRTGKANEDHHLAIPADAVLRNNDTASVLVIENGKIVSRQVLLGEQDTDGWLAVLKGLNEDDKIIAVAATAPAIGTQVQLLTTEAQRQAVEIQ